MEGLLLAVLVIGGLLVTISAGALVSRNWSSGTMEGAESRPQLLLWGTVMIVLAGAGFLLLQHAGGTGL